MTIDSWRLSNLLIGINNEISTLALLRITFWFCLSSLFMSNYRQMLAKHIGEKCQYFIHLWLNKHDFWMSRKKKKSQYCVSVYLTFENFKKKIMLDFFLFRISFEWGWTARIGIARHAFARHFWQQINCSTQILSFARIQLILAKPENVKVQFFSYRNGQ